MKRLLATAAAVAVLVAGTGSGAQAQRAPSLFDLGIYGGAAYNYQWLDDLSPPIDGGTRLNPGWAPTVGAHATFWATPRFGVRTHLGYQWIELPTGSSPSDVNIWTYDLNLVARPFITRTDGPTLINSLYVFLGGGGLTANPPGEDGCVAPYVARYSACLPIDWSKASVGQVTAGFGWDLFSITPSIGLFTEISGNVYDSPFHTSPGFTGRPEPAEDADPDSYGMTGRIVAGLKFAFGGEEPEVVPVPVAPAPPPMAPPPPPPPPPADREITVCVIEGNTLRMVTARFNPTTGDTTITGRDFAVAYPASAPAYASGATWFISSDSITFDNQQYVKFGVSRVIQPTQLSRSGEFQGTGVFTESGAATPVQVLYVPVRPGCEFQPYQLRAAIRPRG